VRRCTSALSYVSLGQTGLDAGRSDGRSERKLVRWATDRTAGHGVERYARQPRCSQAPSAVTTSQRAVTQKDLDGHLGAVLR
jgi:hypothetical protein